MLTRLKSFGVSRNLAKIPNWACRPVPRHHFSGFQNRAKATYFKNDLNSSWSPHQPDRNHSAIKPFLRPTPRTLIMQKTQKPSQISSLQVLPNASLPSKTSIFRNSITTFALHQTSPAKKISSPQYTFLQQRPLSHTNRAKKTAFWSLKEGQFWKVISPQLFIRNNQTQAQSVQTQIILDEKELEHPDIVKTDKKPIIALVGRPNVGKSTLFNRLLSRQDNQNKKSLVSDVEGTTRDRSYGNGHWLGRDFVVVDTGGLVSTTVNEIEKNDVIVKHLMEQTVMAILEADAVIFMVDGSRTEVDHHDRIISKLLKTHSRPVFLVINKVDNFSREEDHEENPHLYKQLGIPGPFHMISASHGSGVGDMLESVMSSLESEGWWPEQENEKEEDPRKKRKRLTAEKASTSNKTPAPIAPTMKKDPLRRPDSIRLAIVGQPNVGKSSLLNAILEKNRCVVSDIPGTTMDPVDEQIEFDGTKFTLIDTAGINRRRLLHKTGVEKSSILSSLRTIERAHVVLHLTEPVKSATKQDEKIASHIVQHNSSAVLVVNKWDMIPDDVAESEARRQYEEHLRNKLGFLNYVPVQFVSAKTHQGVKMLLGLARKIFDERSVRIKTRVLNEIIKKAVNQQAPPYRDRKRPKIRFAVQSDLFPPTFVIWSTHCDLIPDTYAKYLEGKIRDHYPFVGTPIRVLFRQNLVKKKPEPAPSTALQLRRANTLSPIAPKKVRGKLSPRKQQQRAVAHSQSFMKNNFLAKISFAKRRKN